MQTKVSWEERKDNDIECMSPQMREKLPPSSAAWENLLLCCTANKLMLPGDDNSTQAQKSHFTP